MFESKIAIAVNDYLGIKNEASSIELNGMFFIIFYNLYIKYNL